MTTVTRTLPPAARSEPLVFHLAPEPAAALTQVVPAFIDRTLITRLGAILDRHLDKTDTFSLRLAEEGEKFRVYSEEPPETPLRLDANLIAQIKQFRALLRNPIGTALLRDPWLVGDLVWEKSWLDVFHAAVAYFSPNVVVAIRHEFAAEALAWLHALPPSVSSPHQMVQGIAVNQLGIRALGRVRPDLTPQAPTDAWHALEILKYYLALMDMVELERRQDLRIRTLEAMNAYLVVEIDEIDVRRDQDFARRESQLTEYFGSTQEKVTELKTVHESTREIIEKRMTQAEKNLEESEKRLAKAHAEISTLQSTVSNQGAQIAHLSGRVSGLENEVNNSGGFSCSVM